VEGGNTLPLELVVVEAEGELAVVLVVRLEVQEV
jgi:hypothetical protein